MKDPRPFPDQLYVAHYEHSTVESPSLSACLTEREAIEVDDEAQPVEVAEYRLVGVKKLSFEIKEHN